MAQQGKIFIGNCKVKETQYGELITIGINEEDIKKLQENLKGGWTNLTFKRSQAGKPYLEVNTYSGNGQAQQQQQQKPTQQGDTVRPTKQDVEKNISSACQDDDLPF